MLIGYALTILIGALLLFTVQPMVAKMLLPLLGGSPSVWNVCVVFFQAMLLAGYAYAYLLTRGRSRRVQVLVHGAVCLLPLTVLPFVIGVHDAPAPGRSPWLWLLGALIGTVGLPFFVLSTTGPLLQRWFSATDHSSARDPYFLYSTSNLGSLVGLLAYPFLLEPLLRLSTPGASLLAPRIGSMSQTVLWTLCYVVFVVLVWTCGAMMLRRSAPERPEGGAASGRATAGATPLSIGQRARWVLLALVPSSTMLGTTQFLTTDIAAIPLLWVIPLALYLITMMIAFSRRLRVPTGWSSVLLAVLALGIAVFGGFHGKLTWFRIPLHLVTLLAVGFLCHGRLADERPPTDRLTSYYLLIALGGVLGGAFNALLAPLLFTGIAEYPIAIVLACFLRPGSRADAAGRGIWREGVSGVAWALGLVIVIAALSWVLFELGNRVAPEEIRLGVPALLWLAFMGRRVRFALGVAVILIAGWSKTWGYRDLHRERTFFGVHVVRSYYGPPIETVSPDGRRQLVEVQFHLLVNGRTRHGTQAVAPNLAVIPTTYFHPTGPIGQVFESLDLSDRTDRVAILGLGAGTLAAYGRVGQEITYYEIDPAVVRIARDERFFTYLRNSPADVDIVVGDGRLRLREAPDGSYGLIVLDAFSADSVPVHLLTREAVELYFRKLRPGGLLAINLTNAYVDLVPVVDAITLQLGLVRLVQEDHVTSSEQMLHGKDFSVWALLARTREDLGPMIDDPRWWTQPLRLDRPPDPRFLWTDDYSNIVRVLKLW